MHSFARRSRALLLLAGLVLGLSAAGSESRAADGNRRIVFVGDSITGLSRNYATGFAHQMEWALKEVYPGAKPDLVALGGSGQGVSSWLNVEQTARARETFLDVPKIDVRANLDQPCDVLVVMLGMNDILAPYVSEAPEALDGWSVKYGELLDALRKRARPRVVAIAGTTMNTEDPASPKNRLINELNRRAADLAARTGARFIPTSQSCWDILKHGRTLRPDFHVTYDFVHPNEAGHLAIATAMLKALDEPAAAERLESVRLRALWQRTVAEPPAPAKAVPPAWLVAAQLPQNHWEGTRFLPEAARTPIDEAIEKGQHFSGPIDIGQGRKLVWQEYRPSVDYTGLDNPGSVDFSAVTHAANFEGGYGARWIRSERERPVKLDLGTNIFAGDIHLTVWLNGTRLWQGLITAEPGRRKTVDAQLRQGSNVLVFKAAHRAWQWQVYVNLAPAADERLDDLRYATNPAGF